jgi:hypothetical protein
MHDRAFRCIKKFSEQKKIQTTKLKIKIFKMSNFSYQNYQVNHFFMDGNFISYNLLFIDRIHAKNIIKTLNYYSKIYPQFRSNYKEEIKLIKSIYSHRSRYNFVFPL